MSIFNALIRTVTAPIEIGARTISGILDFSDDDIEDGGTCLDIATMGVSRVIRKGASAVHKTANGIGSEFDD